MVRLAFPEPRSDVFDVYSRTSVDVPTGSDRMAPVVDNEAVIRMLAVVCARRGPFLSRRHLWQLVHLPHLDARRKRGVTRAFGAFELRTECQG